MNLFKTLFLFLSFSLSIGITMAQRHVVSGIVRNASDNTPVGFASVKLLETGQSTITNAKGEYSLSFALTKHYHLRVSAMGFAPKKLLVAPKQKVMNIFLVEQSFSLKDVVVTAKYNNKMGSDATVDQDALEYIQPTSLKDIFSLLPGGKIGGNNMQSGGLTTSRQSGADRSTSFGMGVSINGVPLTNDGMRVQLSGMTGETNIDGNANVTVNQGVDMRTISTDHIESVTVTRGVSSAIEGNLSSGSVKVQLKQGKSPLRMRFKFDPKNKLAYIGKGMMLGKKAGNLYVGADIVNSAARIDDRRGAYNRATAQLNYTNQWLWGTTKLNFNVNASQVNSFNNKKADEASSDLNERYSTYYNRSALSAKAEWYMQRKWIDYIELLSSADYTRNRLKYHKFVVLQNGVTPIPLATTEGEHEGVFLPSSYMTYFEVDNKPINAFARLALKKYMHIGKYWNITALAGASYNYVKNIGVGAITDPMRPPFPSSDYIRPRSNKDIPSLQHQASFLEMKWRYSGEKYEWNASVGGRQVMMLHLPNDYALYHKPLFEPRIQTALTRHFEIRRQPLSITLRMGYGRENKLPSIDYLYPDRVFHDFVALNAYYNDVSKRRLITTTKIVDPTNTQLRENKNKKWEIGGDIEYKGFIFSATAFYENMSNGITYFKEFSPFGYTKYYKQKHEVAGKPSRDDFYQRVDSLFYSTRIPTNSVSVVKKGVEYRIHIPEIKALRSEIEINGAYYHTTYSNSVPVMFYPATLELGRPYPYVGLFDGFETTYSSIFNTNCWIHTHLPRWKLLFTNSIQSIWMQSKQLSTDVDTYPTEFINFNGERLPLTPHLIESDATFGRLERKFNSARYKRTTMPIALSWNIKMTKEINKHVRVSFFGNNIVTINPKYKNAYEQTQRVWTSPFFGAELMLSI